MSFSNEIHRLNPRQKEAVLHEEGPLLILAWAGSGKTRVITTRTAYLIGQGVAAESIVAVTFTNKAAKEMRERVSAMRKGKKGKRPVISTFHSLCLSVLRDGIQHLGYRKDFSIYDASEQLSLMRNLMGDIKVQDRSFKVESLMERLSRTKNGVALPEEEDEEDEVKAAVFQSIYPKYQEALRAFNAVDFDDLLLLALRLFREHPPSLDRYRERFRHIMVDEYQDTNRVQYDFIKMLAGARRNLCVVGDDDQSIYGWRGADLGNILDFERDFPGAKVVRLEQNYRSFGHILKAANGVIRNNSKRMEKALWTDRGDGPKVKVFQARTAEEEAKWVSDRIVRLKYEQKLAYEDFAVIYRTNNLSRPFEEALRKERLPYRIVGGTGFFERKEIKDLAAYLKAMANPDDHLSFLRAASAPKRELGATSFEKITAFAQKESITLLDAFARAGEAVGLKGKAAEKAVDFAALLRRYGERFQKRGEMGKSLQGLLEEIGFNDYLMEFYKTLDVARKRIENVEGFVRSLSQYEEEAEAPSLTGFLESLALTDMEEGRDESEGGITLISMHSSKGLEFPVVFIEGWRRRCCRTRGPCSPRGNWRRSGVFFTWDSPAPGRNCISPIRSID
ncbi:MAG: UvrD-helicase domain-containing protein [Nitrospinae bacterium]|nr:UvrD-helicase domain-containing protein [Nitrospinota bacterium]